MQMVQFLIRPNWTKACLLCACIISFYMYAYFDGNINPIDLFLRGGWILVVGFYLFAQMETNCIILTSTHLVITYPLRPFFRRKKFSLTTLQLLKFCNYRLKLTGPTVILFDKGRKRSFFYEGREEKMLELMKKLEALGIMTDIETNDIED